MASNKTKLGSDIGTSPNPSDATKGNTEDVRKGIKRLKLDPFQEDILKVKGHFVLCTGRQVGKTTILAIKAAEYMIANKGARILVVSLTEDQAQLIIIMVLNYLEQNYKSWILKPYSKNVTKNKIVLNNKSQVLSRPVGQTGDAVRGFTGDVLIIDEAAKMNQYIFDSAKPTLLTTGGQIWMCSTPFGKKGYFYESFINKHNRFKVFHVSSEEVIRNRVISESWSLKQREEGLRMLEEEQKDMGKLAYGQEFMGLFMDDLQQIFSDELIHKCCKGERVPKFKDGRYYMGVDIARLGDDEGTYEIIEKLTNGYFRHVENIITKKKLTTQTHDKILDMNKLWNLKAIGIDAGSGSLGVGILDWLLREPTVSNKVIALNNLTRALDKYDDRKRGLLKEDLYSNLLILMERGMITLLNDDSVRLSLKSCQQEYVMKEGQPTKVKIFGNYTHIVEGIVRAAWLANQKNINTSISYF